MGLGEQHRQWDIRSHSPYLGVSEADDKKVMDLSNYNSSGLMMTNCGSSSPVHESKESVLRLSVQRSPSPPCSRGSPQPSRTVITSISSLNLQQHPSSTSSSPISHHHHPHNPHLQHFHESSYYKPNGGALYLMPASPLPVSNVRPTSVGLVSAAPTAAQVAVATSSRKKKLPQPIPEECKDDAYWERRKRNNESAKRSRELRRNKEMQTAERVNFLESENLQLRTEVAMLRNEVEKLRQLLIPRAALNNS